MEPSEYANIARQEDRHWWYLGMRDLSMAMMASTYGDRNDLRILDAGCGVGGMTTVLRRFGHVTGIDASPVALHYARERPAFDAGQADVMALPFPAHSFDLVTSFDVLYHQSVRDLRQALDETYRVLRRNGRLLVRVPAHEWLRGQHDIIVHTGRRFNAGRLKELLGMAGFSIERLTYANMLLLPLAFAQRTAERLVGDTRLPQSGLSHLPSWLNTLFHSVLLAESRWLRAHNLPVGLSVIVVARKH